MMRDLIGKVMTGSVLAGAALLVAACNDGGGEANNAADNGLENGALGNFSDPSAVETMTNGTDAGNGAGTGTDTGAGTNTGRATDTDTDTGADTDTGGTDAGGDTGGNTAEDSINGM